MSASCSANITPANMRCRFALLLALSLILAGSCFAILFVPPTPANNTYTANTSVQINVSIEEANLSSLAYNWNGTNYTMYNNSLIFMANFDNVSSLGENGTAAADISPYGASGTLYNAAYVAGKHGNALSFNGASSNASFPHTSTLNPGSQLTITAWIKATSWSAASYQGTIVGKDEWSGVGSYSKGYVLRVGENGRASFTIGVGNAGTWYEAITPQVMSTGTWYRLTATFNGTLQRIYINGALINSSTTPYFSIGASTYPLVIGSGVYEAARKFNGLIDEVRIWNRTLSASEIYIDYASNLQKYNATQWYLYVNQSKNATAGLDPGTYSYQVFATDAMSSANPTEQRNITISSQALSLNCSSLSAAGTTYNLSSNLTANGSTCFIITAQNVTLNCAGYSVIGNNTLSAFGLYSNQYGTAVANCTFINFTTSIVYNGVSYGSISNTNASTAQAYSIPNGIGIFLNNSASFNNLSRVSAYVPNGRAFFLSSSSNNTISGSSGTSGGSNNHGLLISSSNGNAIANSSFSSNTGYGIQVGTYSNYNTVTNSNGSSDSGFGIYIYTNSNNNTINRSIGLSNTSHGIRVEYICLGSIIANSNATSLVSDSNGYGGLFLSTSSHNTQIINTTAFSNQSSAIYNYGGENATIDCQGRQLSGRNVSGTYGIYSQQNGTVVKNCLVRNFTYAIYLAGAKNGTFLNNTLVPDDSRTRSLLYLSSTSSGNLFIANNFTATSGLYVNDTNGANNYSAPALPNGVEAFWKLDEGTGTTAFDRTGRHNATLLNTPSWTGGRINGGLAFNASRSTYTRASGFTSLGTNNQPYSITGWLNAAAGVIADSVGNLEAFSILGLAGMGVAGILYFTTNEKA